MGLLLCYVMIFMQGMASSSSSSHLSIDDRIHQLEREIKDVADDIQKNRNILEQSSDEKEKDFLRTEITQLRQKELLLLQQRAQQQQQQAGKTVLYDELYLISYGLHYDDNNHRMS